MKNNYKIPVMRPCLPSAEKVFPYLKEIDENRWYSNFGPLVQRLNKRFSSLFKIDEDCIVTVSSGTLGIVSALKAFDFPDDSVCILPAWTFVAVPSAVISSGFKVYFCDIDKKTLSLDPETVRKQLKKIDGDVRAVVVPYPFGIPVNTRAWEEFSLQTGVEVVIDAAAGFDAIYSNPELLSSTIPIAISLHATKAFGTGEGGLVVCKNNKLLQRIRQNSNFGYTSQTLTHVFIGINGKMSEYTAAVAHAELDGWEEKRKKWQQVTSYYINSLDNIGVGHLLTNDYVLSTCNIIVPDADKMAEELAKRGIETRQWYKKGVHHLPAYENSPRSRMTNTDFLGRGTIGIPFSVDITKDQIDYICSSIKEILHLEKVKKTSLEKVLDTL